MAGTAQDLAAAILELVPESVLIAAADTAVTVYDGVVTDKNPPNIYFAVNSQVPNVTARSEGGSPASLLCRVAVTAGARTAVAVRDMATAVIDALDQVKPLADGWETGPLLMRSTRGPETSQDVTFTDGTQVVYGRFEFELTASRLS